jgi:hypothetical protein
VKQPKKFKRHIPVLLKNKLDKLTYNRKDDLYVIIDLIHRKEIYYKSDYQNRYGYTEIALTQFKEYIASSDHLNTGIQFLVDNNLILRNEYFVIGYKSKSYKIPREYLGRTVPVWISDKNINKRIASHMKKSQKTKAKNLEFAQTEYFKTFRIDIDGANKDILSKTVTAIKSLCYRLNVKLSDSDILDIITCKKGHERKRFVLLLSDKLRELDNIMHRYMIYTTRINAINDGFLFFKRNNTNGRLDTNLTSLPSFLRPYLISEEKLMHLDIKNSQPYFFYTCIQNDSTINKEELARFGKLVIEGTLYEFLGEEYKKQTGYSRTRNQMKKGLYKIFFSKVPSFQHLKTFFGGQFPTIMEHINQTNEKDNSTLAKLLQSKESYTVLDVIMPMLEEKGIRPYTIHDSFVCKESEALTIKEIFITKLTELYGIAPALHLDYLIPTELEEDDIITDFGAFVDEMNALDELEKDN